MRSDPPSNKFCQFGLFSSAALSSAGLTESNSVARWGRNRGWQIQICCDASVGLGATHFLMKRLPKVATEMSLHLLAYNLTRVMNIIGVKPLLAAIQA